MLEKNTTQSEKIIILKYQQMLFISLMFDHPLPSSIVLLFPFYIPKPSLGSQSYCLRTLKNKKERITSVAFPSFAIIG